MHKNFKYLGINRAVPQSDAPDGSCQEMINVRYRNGAWRPIGPKLHYKNLPIGTYTEIFLHDIEQGLVNGQANWIGYDSATSKLFLINPDSGASTEIASFGDSADIGVVFLKRTMIVTSDLGVSIFIWNTETKAYAETASLPVPDVDFVSYDPEIAGVQADEFHSWDAIVGKFYSNLNRLSMESGKMYGSIMYITAYRLFDGSYILPSIPRYFQISNGGNLKWRNPDGGHTDDAMYWLEFSASKLRVTIDNEPYRESFEDTKDLIESICVFATRSTYLHEILESSLTDAELAAQYGTYANSSANINTFPFKDVFQVSDDFTKLTKAEGWYKIHEFSFEDIVGKTGRTIKDADTIGYYQDYATRQTLPTDQFSHHKLNAKVSYVYNDRLHLFNVKTVIGVPYVVWPKSLFMLGDIPVKTNEVPGQISVFLKSALGQSVQISSCMIPIYQNGRYEYSQSFGDNLALAIDYLADLENGTAVFNGIVLTNYCMGSGFIEDLAEVNEGSAHLYRVYFNIWTEIDKYFILPSAIGYNDSRAYKIQISTISGGSNFLLAEKKLTKNESMNFAIWNNETFSTNQDAVSANYKLLKYPINSLITLAELPSKIELPFDTNRLQVSELQNPLVFPAKNSYQIGTGDGIALMAGSEPLSSGQFGQFPLQAFTTKGVWALEIGTGDVLYTNVLPSSSQVAENRRNIISVGSGVVYSTLKGLFILQGRESVQISSIVEGEPNYPLTNTPDIEFLINSDDTNTHFTPGLSNALSSVDFLTYLQGSQIGIYHIGETLPEMIVTNPGFGYSYIYSFESKTWTKISGSYTLLINSYPELLGVNTTDIVLLGSEVTNSQHVEVLIVSNALSLEMTDVYKKIERVIQRSRLSSNVGKLSLFHIYASDDLNTWQPITGKQKDGLNVNDLLCQRSHGSAKYFAIVFSGTLSCQSEIKNVEIFFKEKWNNRLR